MDCVNCGYRYADVNENGEPISLEYCHYEGIEDYMPCQYESAPARYTVMYEGYLFMGDSDGLNCHDYDDWKEIQGILGAYGTDFITVRDNEYGVYLEKGEWS